MISTKLEAKNTTLFDSYIQFYMFTNIEYIHTYYTDTDTDTEGMQHTKNGAKCNLMPYFLLWIHNKKTKIVQGSTWKGQMPLSNIHPNKGKYPQNGEEPFTCYHHVWYKPH